jgi:hypothetical protein
LSDLEEQENKEEWGGGGRKSEVIMAVIEMRKDVGKEGKVQWIFYVDFMINIFTGTP